MTERLDATNPLTVDVTPIRHGYFSSHTLTKTSFKIWRGMKVAKLSKPIKTADQTAQLGLAILVSDGVSETA